MFDSSGPSPRAWGPRLLARRIERQGRSIPTRVGTSLSYSSPVCARSVHPHARGDLTCRNQGVQLKGGPSPRAWGPRLCLVGHHGIARSIPTRVGTSRSATSRASPSPVHPHARGDLVWAFYRTQNPDGPSPRAWGPRSPCRPASRRPAVHPHARGDLGRRFDVAATPTRSIPTRVGTSGRRCRRGWTPTRSIPTRVGTSY